jgi:putative ABC transport system ATP-binding protein
MHEDLISAVGGSVLLEGRGLGKIYGEGELAVRVLHASELTVRSGEVVVIVGPSGSGKTTLLSMLGLVLSPTEGEVWLGAERVSGLSHDSLARVRLRSMGFVFQQFNLMQGLTALENVELPLLLSKTDRRERRERALAALEQVGLADRAQHKPRQLSGGQQQRVAIARAVVTNPSVVLCDEPTASLDGTSGKLVLDLLRKLVTGAERAVLVVTHDERVVRIADRVVEVAEGHVRERSGVLKGAA